MMPFNILGMWFRSILGLVILIGGIYSLKQGYDRSWVDEPVTIVAEQRLVEVKNDATQKVFLVTKEWNEANRFLLGGLTLLVWALLGGLIQRAFLKLKLHSNSESETARLKKAELAGESHSISRPDGSVLEVKTYGPKGGSAIIWTHGWGLNNKEWCYQKADLATKYRLIVWDEPGLGKSTKPANNEFNLENFARDLAAVVDFCRTDKVFLAGHSIGGMTILTFCKMFPEILSKKISGLILVHTTHTNPVRTTKMAGLYTAIEKPVIVPMLYLTIWTWPLVWAMNWISYLNGSAHRSTRKSSFAGTETFEQVEYVARAQTMARPDTLARGMLGMLKYDATNVLAGIRTPTLVVIGDKDKTTLPSTGEFIAAHVPNSRLETLSPARHQGLLEHHARFNKLVAGFVDGQMRN